MKKFYVRFYGNSHAVIEACGYDWANGYFEFYGDDQCFIKVASINAKSVVAVTAGKPYEEQPCPSQD